jgi:hypothetical protein
LRRRRRRDQRPCGRTRGGVTMDAKPTGAGAEASGGAKSPGRCLRNAAPPATGCRQRPAGGPPAGRAMPRRWSGAVGGPLPGMGSCPHRRRLTGGTRAVRNRYLDLLRAAAIGAVHEPRSPGNGAIGSANRNGRGEHGAGHHRKACLPPTPGRQDQRPPARPCVQGRSAHRACRSPSRSSSTPGSERGFPAVRVLRPSRCPTVEV